MASPLPGQVQGFGTNIYDHKQLRGSLRKHLISDMSSRPLHSARVFLLPVPKISEIHSTATWSKALSVYTPVVWNRIPVVIWQTSTICTFPKQLDTLLFQQAFPTGWKWLWIACYHVLVVNWSSIIFGIVFETLLLLFLIVFVNCLHTLVESNS